ncbi:MAG: response regulator [Deltaproteobacteria bacterium]|nr:response regulator [Deltaproteobacteria bacterium]
MDDKITVGGPTCPNALKDPIRILVADDEPAILDLYRHVLSRPAEMGPGLTEFLELEAQLFHQNTSKSIKYSFDLVTFRQADDAVYAVQIALEQKRPFAVAFLDIRMPPGPSGVWAAENIRALDPMIEIVMVTGYSDIDPGSIVSRVLPVHKLLYVQKPFHPQEIYQFATSLGAKWKMETTLSIYHKNLEKCVEKRTEALVQVNEELRKEIDIRKNTETALRESEAKYKDLFENGSDLLCLHDLEGKLIETNLAFKKEYGFTGQDLSHIHITELIPERHRHKVQEYLNRIIKTGKDNNIAVIQTKNGRELHVEYKSTLVVDMLGSPMAARFSGRDVTARLTAEKQKQKLETQLLQIQRMEAIGTLAGGIAHNFNNILMGILGNAAMSHYEFDPSHPIHQKLDNIERLVNSGSKLTGQLLAYARGGNYEVKPINLNRLLKETVTTFGVTRKDIIVHQILSNDLWNINADQGQIEQVLLNLYVNAADAMVSGGELFIETKNVSNLQMNDKPYQMKPGNYVHLSVRDTGIGMDPEALKHIFEPFFTTKGLAKGTGMGLASVYGIIKAHAGYIDVYSQKGQGSSFHIYLPATREKSDQHVPPQKPTISGHETILLVDDEEMVLDIGEQMLKFLGYQVIKAKSGKQAIEIYGNRKDDIDMVILDMIIPEMGGSIIYDKLVDIKKNTKVLLSSGYSIDGQAMEIMRRGCNGFIQKPFNIEKLSAKIKEILIKEKSDPETNIDSSDESTR